MLSQLHLSQCSVGYDKNKNIFLVKYLSSRINFYCHFIYWTDSIAHLVMSKKLKCQDQAIGNSSCNGQWYFFFLGNKMREAKCLNKNSSYLLLQNYFFVIILYYISILQCFLSQTIMHFAGVILILMFKPWEKILCCSLW